MVTRGCARAGKPSAGKLGKFLVQAQFQGSVHSSALFLTAAAQNLLCMKLATELGVAIPNPWVTWFKGAPRARCPRPAGHPAPHVQGARPTGSSQFQCSVRRRAWEYLPTSVGDQQGCCCAECAFSCSPPRPSLALTVKHYCSWSRQR